MKEKNRGMVIRDIPDDMFQRKSVQKLAEHRDTYSDLACDIIFINRNRIREKSCISAHKNLKQLHHRRFRQIHIIQIIPVGHYLHLRRNVHILRQCPVTCPFNIDQRVIYGLTLQLEMSAELLEIELQLPAGSDIIRNIIKDMDLMVDIFDILQRRE